MLMYYEMVVFARCEKVQIFAGGWRYLPVESATGLCLPNGKT